MGQYLSTPVVFIISAIPCEDVFSFVVEKTYSLTCAAALNRSSHECCFLLPVQIYILHPQLHTSPAGDARPGSADTCISVISVKACEEEQNLVPWVLWWISPACSMGFILSLLQTHPWNPSALTFYPLTYTLWESIKANLFHPSDFTVYIYLHWPSFAVIPKPASTNTSCLCCETFPFHHSHSGVVCRSQTKQSLSALFFPKCKRGNAAPVMTVLVMFPKLFWWCSLSWVAVLLHPSCHP